MKIVLHEHIFKMQKRNEVIEVMIRIWYIFPITINSNVGEILVDASPSLVEKKDDEKFVKICFYSSYVMSSFT